MVLIDGPIPVNLDLARTATEEKVANFLFNGDSKGKVQEVAERFSKDVEEWKKLYDRRLAEIERELNSAREWSFTNEERTRQLLNERAELRTNPPFIWLAKLYGKAVESYLESTQRRFGRVRSGKSA